MTGASAHTRGTSPNELLPCHFLSQNEIVRIAESEDEQIHFIDSFFDFRTHQRAINETRTKLSTLDKQVEDQIRARKLATELKAEKARLVREIAAKDAELKSPIFAKFQQAQTKMQWLGRAGQTVSDLVAALEQARARVEVVPSAPDLPGELSTDPLSQQVRDLANNARREALRTFDDAIAAVSAIGKDVNARQDDWRLAYEAIADEYSKEAHKAGGDVPALSQARARFVARLNPAPPKSGHRTRRRGLHGGGRDPAN